MGSCIYVHTHVFACVRVCVTYLPTPVFTAYYKALPHRHCRCLSAKRLLQMDTSSPRRTTALLPPHNPTYGNVSRISPHHKNDPRHEESFIVSFVGFSRHIIGVQRFHDLKFLKTFHFTALAQTNASCFHRASGHVRVGGSGSVSV